MALFNPLTWDFDFFLLGSGNDPSVKRRRRERIILSGVYLSTAALSVFWLALVTNYVPNPYLDEVFHIPQAQAYCEGNFEVWDPKLTTPPGLYIYSSLLIKFIGGGSCTVLKLRATNTFTLLMLLPTVYNARNLITKKPAKMGNGKNHVQGLSIDWDAVHTAVNICLFPLMFFFSGLYYTDVLSTLVVIKSYEHFLQARDKQLGSISSGLLTFVIGVVSLFMRQTNIFWVAVFMGGLELTRTFRPLSFLLPTMSENSQKLARSNTSDVAFQHSVNYDSKQGHLNTIIFGASSGTFYDPKLEEAGALDFFWSVTSLMMATISNPIRIVRRLWPHVALLLSFTAFVFWNGGVVLGDKSNHVATIHLPQMLYIWPFMAFFSLPLLTPSIAQYLYWTFRRGVDNPSARRGEPQNSTVSWLLVSTLLATVVVHFNTIIHPFTLADNRHYVFYVFRYSIRQHWTVKYLLAHIYVMCAYFVFHTLAGSGLPHSNTTTSNSPKQTVTALLKGRSALSDSYSTSSPPSTSFTIIWLISTALSLITAPLVEPRYFIIPWVIWRLHVPTLLVESSIEGPNKGNGDTKEKRAITPTPGWASSINYWAYEGHDYRLWLETIWFFLISLVTGYIFLFEGFTWPQEPGKLQRFMW